MPVMQGVNIPQLLQQHQDLFMREHVQRNDRSGEIVQPSRTVPPGDEPGTQRFVAEQAAASVLNELRGASDEDA
ncbi:hypothetical protein D3C74_455240 [compost metagenome]